MSVRICRPKLFKNLCLSLVSGVPHFFSRTTPLVLISYACFGSVPESDASVGVEFRVRVDAIYGDADCARTCVAAEVVAHMPRCQQTHLELRIAMSRPILTTDPSWTPHSHVKTHLDNRPILNTRVSFLADAIPVTTTSNHHHEVIFVVRLKGKFKVKYKLRLTFRVTVVKNCSPLTDMSQAYTGLIYRILSVHLSPRL